MEEEHIPANKAAIYVGETSRSILERTREHWKGYEGAKKDNHIWKHQEMEHKGEQVHHESGGEPQVCTQQTIQRGR